MDVVVIAIAVVVVVMLTVALLWRQIAGDRRSVPNATRRGESRRRVRRIVRAGYPFVLVIVGASILVVGIGARVLGIPSVEPIRFLGQILIFGGIALTYARFFSLRRRVERLGFEVCPDCEYRLAGLAERGRCPECGFECDRESLRATWEEVWGLVRLGKRVGNRSVRDKE